MTEKKQQNIEDNNKSHKEASILFHSIMKASIKNNIKYAIRLKGDVYIGNEVGDDFIEVIGIDKAKKYIERINATTVLENIKIYKVDYDFSQSEIVEVK